MPFVKGCESGFRGYAKYLEEQLRKKYGDSMVDRVNAVDTFLWKGEFNKEEWIKFIIEWESTCGKVLTIHKDRMIPIVGINANGKVFRDESI